VPAIPGCATQGETFEELLENLYEAVEGCLNVDLESVKEADRGKDWRSRSRTGVRQRGHHIYGKPGTRVRLSVPIHGNKSVKKGLLKHLLKLAGVPRKTESG
jgi:hypothetical protein